jgi:hypothetical protein
MTKDIANYYTAKVDKVKKPLRLNCDATKLNKHKKAIQKYKALCYKDICLWIVQNPKRKERDLLAIKVYLRHHKGVDNKLKLYITLPCVLSLS